MAARVWALNATGAGVGVGLGVGVGVGLGVGVGVGLGVGVGVGLGEGVGDGSGEGDGVGVAVPVSEPPPPQAATSRLRAATVARRRVSMSGDRADKIYPFLGIAVEGTTKPVIQTLMYQGEPGSQRKGARNREVGGARGPLYKNFSIIFYPVDPHPPASVSIVTNYLRQNWGVSSTSTDSNSSRPRSMAKVHTHTWKSVSTA